MQEPFCLFETHAFHLPYNLEFSRRTGQDVIWFRDGARVFDGFQSFRSPMIQVEINMPDGLDVFLRSRRGILPERVHPYINVRPVGVLVAQPGLKLRTRRLLRAGDALNGFSEVPVQHEHGDPVGLLEVVEDIFRSGRNKCSWVLHLIHRGSL